MQDFERAGVVDEQADRQLRVSSGQQEKVGGARRAALPATGGSARLCAPRRTRGQGESLLT